MNRELKFRVLDKRNKTFLQQYAPYYYHLVEEGGEEIIGEANLYNLTYYLCNPERFVV